MVETVRIRIDPFIKKSLDALKTDENDTYSCVISSLNDQCAEHVAILAEKEQYIRDECVERTVYDKLWCDFTENAEKIKGLEDKIRDLNDKEQEQDFAGELKKQEDAYVDLQGTLTVKEDELNAAHGEISGLKEGLDKLKIEHDTKLSDIHKQHDDVRLQYNNLRKYANECIDVDTMNTLYHIVRFLHGRKHSFFTIDQLADKLPYDTRDAIVDALALAKYNIFPVRQYLIKNVECYGFDRHYLKG